MLAEVNMHTSQVTIYIHFKGPVAMAFLET